GVLERTWYTRGLRSAWRWLLLYSARGLDAAATENAGPRLPGMRLRQVVLAAADLTKTRTLVEDELGLPHVWADPGVGVFGLRNALYAIGDSFLEVVSPIRDDAPVRRFLNRAGGDAGYMAIVQTTDPLDEVRARADALPIRV